MTREVLEYLGEFDDRQLYAGLGFSSMWAYCTQALGLCQTTATRRIAAARVCREFPEVLARVDSGELQVSVLAELKQHLSKANAAELFEACAGRSFRDVVVLLAARFPQADEPDSTRVAGTPDVGCEGSQWPEPIAADRFRVRFTASTEFCAALERVRALAAHRLSNGDLATLLQRGLEAYQRELERQRFGLGAKARIAKRGLTKIKATPTPTPISKQREHVPAAVAREVYVRDGKQCTFVSARGRRCESRRWLEFDHIQPVAMGGRATLENLRLRCATHNRWYAQRCFGRAAVRAMVARARSRDEAA